MESLPISKPESKETKKYKQLAPMITSSQNILNFNDTLFLFHYLQFMHFIDSIHCTECTVFEECSTLHSCTAHATWIFNISPLTENISIYIFFFILQSSAWFIGGVFRKQWESIFPTKSLYDKERRCRNNYFLLVPAFHMEFIIDFWSNWS